MQQHFAHVDEYRMAKAPDGQGKYWLWRFDRDGTWLFVKAIDKRQVEQAVKGKRLVHEDDRYRYWH